MSATEVIRVDGLGKRYRLGERGHGASRPRHLREAFGQTMKRVAQVGRGDRTGAATAGEFWALKDVEFTVQQGEVVGIIGRNGAGKSTLLKILSRITKPTLGEIKLRGRVGSLLEVGTGFHPELTGRENIFLNGAILGMTRSEVRRKLDEIIAFSEIERFMDTPVKHYSSGMYTRLAFAVAAHLEPEILIVDEVLAVGDVGFQKKCLGKMGEIASAGRTVLFVSHNMHAVETLTSRAVLLEDGKIRKIGHTPDVINLYLKASRAAGSTKVDLERFRQGGRSPHLACFKRIWFVSRESSKQPVKLKFLIQASITQQEAVLLFNLVDERHRPVLSWSSSDASQTCVIQPGQNEVTVSLGPVGLPAGDYAVDAWINPSPSQLAWDAVEQAPVRLDQGALSITAWPKRAVCSSIDGVCISADDVERTLS